MPSSTCPYKCDARMTTINQPTNLLVGIIHLYLFICIQFSWFVCHPIHSVHKLFNSDELENTDSVDESDGREAAEPMEEIHGDFEKHESSEDKEEESIRTEGMKDHERIHDASLSESVVIQENPVDDRFSRGSIIVPVCRKWEERNR